MKWNSAMEFPKIVEWVCADESLGPNYICEYWESEPIVFACRCKDGNIHAVRGTFNVITKTVPGGVFATLETVMDHALEREYLIDCCQYLTSDYIGKWIYQAEDVIGWLYLKDYEEAKGATA